MNEKASNNAPAHSEADKPQSGDTLHCKCCGAPFTVKGAWWKKFCTAECKKAYEQVYTDLISEIRPHIRRAAERLAEKRTKPSE